MLLLLYPQNNDLQLLYCSEHIFHTYSAHTIYDFITMMALQSTTLFLLLTTFAYGASAMTPHERLLTENDSGMQMARLLQETRHLQYEDMPDICSGFEMIIDQIPNGRQSCDCDGIAIHCLFHAVCPEGVDDARCADAVVYEVSFEDDELTIMSCAAIAEGNFLETCAKISLGPTLMLDQCLYGSYGGEPCDCEVCEDRQSLSLDCTMHDPRAKTTCQSMVLAEVSPMVHGFNHSAPVPELPTVSDARAVSGAPTKQLALLALSVSSVIVLLAAIF